MNYRHAFHAGNFADVVKHLALVSALGFLARKQTPFAVIDTHAGRGLYDLTAAQAQKTGEAAGGIGRLDGQADSPPLLAKYLALVAESGPQTYPGSPLLAARLLRPQDRLVAIEKHPEECALLREVLRPWRKAKVEEADGYERLIALLPPVERRGLVLIDPPFEVTDEFARLGTLLRAALARFATGVYMVWFPVKAASEANRFCAEVLGAGVKKALRIDIAIDPSDGKLARAGLLIVNPPYGLDQEMEAALAVAAPLMGAKATFDWLAKD
jgi:23S rRNA (adenine2030-N6)-methyltransferase